MFEIELIICIKMDLALNNLQRLICHQTKTTNQPVTWVTDSISYDYNHFAKHAVVILYHYGGFGINEIGNRIKKSQNSTFTKSLEPKRMNSFFQSLPAHGTQMHLQSFWYEQLYKYIIFIILFHGLNKKIFPEKPITWVDTHTHKHTHI